MNKEEILEASKRENKRKDLYAIEVDSNGTKLAGIIGVVLTTVLCTLEIILKGTRNDGIFAIAAAFIAVTSLYRGSKIKRVSSIVAGIIWTIFAIALCVPYVTALVSAPNIL